VTQSELFAGAGDAFYQEPGEKISQGDIFANLMFVRIDTEAVRVDRHKTITSAWNDAPAGARVALRVEEYPALVITHDCAIDKMLNVLGVPEEEIAPEKLRERQRKTDVLVAPIRPVRDVWSQEKFDSVMDGRVPHQFLIAPHDASTWGGGYVDLRWMVTYRLTELVNEHRLFLLNENERARLTLQIDRYFSWRDREPPPIR